MKKKVSLLLLVMMLVFTGSVLASSAIIIKVNGTTVKGADAKLINNTTYVPLRAISEMLGSKVNWDQKTKTVSINTQSATSIEGTWQGTYTASQGETSVNLVIKGETASFIFGPTANNSGVPNGQYQMLYNHNGATNAIKLEGVKWVNKPSNYDMVDLVGSVSGNYINGAVVQNGRHVGEFSVIRK